MKKILYIICLMFVLSSCNYLDIVPTGKVIPEKVTEFRALLTNGYSAFPKYKYLLSLRSDEVMPIVGKIHTPETHFAGIVIHFSKWNRHLVV